MLVDLKVKVSSEAESKEVQELFFELGFQWKYNNLGKKTFYCKEDVFLYAIDGVLGTGTVGQLDFFNKHQAKEITLPQLRDLVVLNRNSIDDATHTDGNYSFYVGKDKNYFFSSCDKAWRGTWKNVDILKPIEKPMKEPKQAEFLVKTNSGYVLQVLDENSGGADVVRIPDGAEIAILSSGVVYFWKSHFFNGGVHKYWVEMKGGWDASWYLKSVPSAITIWKRETLNDQVASAEEYREMISNAASIGLTSVVTDIAQSCSGGAIRNASSQGQSEFPLNNYELNHRVAKAFNAVRGTDLNEDDVNYIRELISLTVSHYGERK